MIFYINNKFNIPNDYYFNFITNDFQKKNYLTYSKIF